MRLICWGAIEFMSSGPDPVADGEPVTVFLSYARPDRVQARKLAAALEHAGFTVWWDALIEGGAAFASSSVSTSRSAGS